MSKKAERRKRAQVVLEPRYTPGVEKVTYCVLKLVNRLEPRVGSYITTEEAEQLTADPDTDVTIK